MGTTPVEAGSARLSPRELEVARLVSEGLTNREIGERLFISERTVDGHLEHIREKLEVNTRAQVSAWVMRQAVSTGVASPALPTIQRAPQIRQVRWPIWVAALVVLAILVAVVLVRLNQPSGPVISTVAGTGSIGAPFPGGGQTGDNGAAIHAELSRPTGVATTSDGSIYIADYGNSVIRRVDSGQIITTVAGGGLAPLADPSVATHVALTYASTVGAAPGSNRLYVLTIVAGDLEIWSLQDSFLNFEVSLGSSRGASTSQQYGLPVGGLVVAKDGTVYIADRAENRVWRWSPPSRPELYAGTGQTGFSGDGAAAKGARLDWPVGLALDPRSGDLYIADSGNNCVRRVDASERITTVAGVCGEDSGNSGDGGRAIDARLSFPYGVAVGGDGTLFIADTGNNKVREVTKAGVIGVLAGTGVAGLGGDGAGAVQAQLAGPSALTIDPRTGDLLIADTANQRVRRVSGLSR
jgi:DNA-binding CsgD family transcriptional regulator